MSYFLRASRMYDSLMQMGRWFGYRPGYVDLCRLYITPDLEMWFRHVANAAEELRGRLDHMAMIGATPGAVRAAHPIARNPACNRAQQDAPRARIPGVVSGRRQNPDGVFQR